MPKDPLDKLIDRPKRRRFFKPRQAAWLVLEPNRLGMAGGGVAGLGALILYFVRHISGYPMSPERVLIGAAMTFVVGYGAVGIFTWYLLWVAEKEIPVLEEEQHFGIRRDPAQATPEAPIPPTEINEDV